MNFNDLNEEKKPREKAIKYGIESLNDEELLAIILRTGTKEKNVLSLAQEIIFTFGGLENFTKINLKSLINVKGIGTSKALEILSCLELSKRIKTINKQQKFLKIIGRFLRMYRFITLTIKKVVISIFVTLIIT